MTDKPIIFSGPMIRALLDGQKTQTRRVLTPVTATFGSAPPAFWSHADLTKAWADGQPYSGMYLHVPCHMQEDSEQNVVGIDCRHCAEYGWNTTSHRLWPRIEVGDRLWVRETCGRRTASFLGIEATNGVEEAFYLADGEDVLDAHEFNLCPWFKGKSCPSIHMPRWASRLTLIVEAVKVERLQDISEEDARAEGCADAPGTFSPSAIGVFANLWRNLHGPDAWSENPWVAAIRFRVIRTNIDAIPGEQP